MKYEGKLYGRVRGQYLELQETTADFERLKAENELLRSENEAMLNMLKNIEKADRDGFAIPNRWFSAIREFLKFKKQEQ